MAVLLWGADFVQVRLLAHAQLFCVSTVRSPGSEADNFLFVAKASEES